MQTLPLAALTGAGRRRGLERVAPVALIWWLLGLDRHGRLVSRAASQGWPKAGYSTALPFWSQ
jgi:hypothetical protein